MPDNFNKPLGDEESLNDLIASAMKKKQQQNLSDSKKDYFAETYKEPSANLSENDDNDNDIEAMVAKAVKAKAQGKKNPGEHFVSESDIYENDGNDYPDDDEDIDEDDEERKPRGKVAAFFHRHKLKFIIAGLILVLLLCVAVLAAVIIFKHYYNRIPEGNNSIIEYSRPDVNSEDTVSDVEGYEEWLENQLRPYDDIMSSKEVYNILLVGEDLRDTSEQSRGNTDVMMLISINNETKKITLTSFMRDIYLYIPGQYSTKLNAAYAIGGAELLKDTIEQNFGVSIDNYVIVNFYTFIEIVEAIGGIEAEITQEMVWALDGPMREQNMYLGNKSSQDLIKEPGTYLLNGNQALGYARIRHGVGDDYGRTQRQREVIRKMIEKSRDMSLAEMKNLLDDVTDSEDIKWDLSESDVLSLLMNAFDYYRNYEIQDVRIPASGTFTTQKIRGMDCLCPDFAKNIEILQLAVYGHTLIDPESSTTTYYLPPSTSTTTTTPPTTTTTTTTTTTPPSETTSSDTSSETTPPSESSVPGSDVSDVSSDSGVSTTPPSETSPSDTGSSSYISSSDVSTPSVSTPSETTSSTTTPTESTTTTTTAQAQPSAA